MPPEMVYDVLHDIEYRWKLDADIIDRRDIIWLAASADVGCCAWRCQKPLENRDVVTVRCWKVAGGYHTIIKHPMLKKLHKACVKHPAWKRQHDAPVKPWLYPEHNQLPLSVLSGLVLQRAASMENVDEGGLSEAKDERGDRSVLEN